MAEVAKTEDKNFLLSHPRRRTTSSPEIENHSRTQTVDTLLCICCMEYIWKIFLNRPLQKFRHINSWSQVRGKTL